VLVPLSASMYVNGSLADNDKFLIDIGTGYYVERNRQDAIDYFKRKVAFVTRELERYAKIAQEKVNIRECKPSFLLILNFTFQVLVCIIVIFSFIYSYHRSYSISPTSSR